MTIPFDYNFIILLVDHAYMVYPPTFIMKTRDIPGECSGDIFILLDFPPSGNTLTITNESVENLKALDYIYSIRKALIKKSKTCGPPSIKGEPVDTNISSI